MPFTEKELRQLAGAVYESWQNAGGRLEDPYCTLYQRVESELTEEIMRKKLKGAL